MIGDGYAAGSILLDIQYEHNGCFDRRADYARKADKRDPEKNDDIFVDHSFSSDDDPTGPR